MIRKDVKYCRSIRTIIMFSVYQHWDPLQACAVGRSYPPEFYSFIENPKVRSVMERIAIETEEDYQKLIKILESFNVTVVRNDISENREDHFWAEHYSQPPMTPRDHTAMIGEKFYMPGPEFGNMFDDMSEFEKELSILQSNKKLTSKQKEDLSIAINKKLKNGTELNVRKFKSIIRSINHNPLTTFPNNKKFNTFASIEKFLKDNNTEIIYDKYINSATTTRVGKDLYVGTVIKDELKTIEFKNYLKTLKNEFGSDYRTHIVNCGTHNDGCFTPVKPGLIISLKDIQTYSKTFPDWEVVYLPNQSWDKVQPFLDLKEKNNGKWWVPGEELNDDFTDFVESWLKDWVLYVEETVFDVNMLVINPTNVIVNNYNKKVFDAFDRHGITAHICNFRHRYFWDGGLHCITSDLSREGTMQDYFPERNK
jgi:N-dimethylarginine dimethylaminohydrolase